MENSTIKSISALVAEGKIQPAIEELLIITSDTDYYDNAVQISNNFHKLNESIIRGILHNDEIFIKNARISNSIIELLKIASESAANKTALNSKEQFKNILIFVGKSFLLALPIFIIFLYIELVPVSGYSFEEFILVCFLFAFFYGFTFPVIVSLFCLRGLEKIPYKYPKFGFVFPPMVFVIFCAIPIFFISTFNNSNLTNTIISIEMLIYITSYIFVIYRLIKSN